MENQTRNKRNAFRNNNGLPAALVVEGIKHSTQKVLWQVKKSLKTREYVAMRMQRDGVVVFSVNGELMAYLSDGVLNRVDGLKIGMKPNEEPVLSPEESSELESLACAFQVGQDMSDNDVSSFVNSGGSEQTDINQFVLGGAGHTYLYYEQDGKMESVRIERSIVDTLMLEGKTEAAASYTQQPSEEVAFAVSDSAGCERKSRRSLAEKAKYRKSAVPEFSGTQDAGKPILCNLAGRGDMIVSPEFVELFGGIIDDVREEWEEEDCSISVAGLETSEYVPAGDEEIVAAGIGKQATVSIHRNGSTKMTSMSLGRKFGQRRPKRRTYDPAGLLEHERSQKKPSKKELQDMEKYVRDNRMDEKRGRDEDAYPNSIPEVPKLLAMLHSSKPENLTGLVRILRAENSKGSILMVAEQIIRNSRINTGTAAASSNTGRTS